ncbi:MAG TPA: C-terminal binding protein [Planctomycetaceae bacterium]|nr:C-terminal binding protein [Planctomycetaceae bacterium]
MTARWRVLLTDRAWPDTTIEQAALDRIGAELVEAPSTDEEILCRLAANCDAIAANWAKVTPAVIDAAPRCRVISRTGIGIDNISVDAATARGIPVTNCPDYCVDEVADHALGLLLACARRIGFLHHRTKQGEYNLAAVSGLQRLSTQTLGLFGLGRIGREFCSRARACKLHVIAHTASGSDHGTGCEMVSLDELLRRSDYLSLHAPSTPATFHLFNVATLALMKSTAYLINTARGNLIDHEALWAAIQSGKLAGAALDVFEPEPPDLSQPLFQDERVIVTPHAAFVSDQALAQMRTQAFEQLAAGLQGQRPQNVINPQIYTAAATSPLGGTAAK